MRYVGNDKFYLFIIEYSIYKSMLKYLKIVTYNMSKRGRPAKGT